MLETSPELTLLFILTTGATYLLFILAMSTSENKTTKRIANLVAIMMLLWIIFQSTLALNAWYMDRKTMPPHMMFPIITSTLLITALFVIPRTKVWIDSLSIKMLTWIHIVRIPVEIGLFMLASAKQLPWSMTFKGYNYDIIFGITAPIIAILFFNVHKMGNKAFLLWNVLGLISVLAVVTTGIGSLPSPIQWRDFTQPNYAVMHFPFVWLPSFIVPVVIFAHIATIRRLLKSK